MRIGFKGMVATHMCSYWCWVRSRSMYTDLGLYNPHHTPHHTKYSFVNPQHKNQTQATTGLYPYEGSNCYFPGDKNHHGPPTDFCMGNGG